jgi:hypothetical protein
MAFERIFHASSRPLKGSEADGTDRYSHNKVVVPREQREHDKLGRFGRATSSGNCCSNRQQDCPNRAWSASRNSFHPQCPGFERPRKKSRTTNLGPFGEVLRQTGPMANDNPLRFATQYCDDESDIS